MDESGRSSGRHLRTLIVAIAMLGSIAHGQIGTLENLAGLREFCLWADAQSDTLSQDQVRADIIDIVLRQAQLFGFSLSTNCRFMAGPGEELTQAIMYVTTWSQGSAVTTQLHVVDIRGGPPNLPSVWAQTLLDGDIPLSIRRGAHASQARSLFESFMLAWRSQNP